MAESADSKVRKDISLQDVPQRDRVQACLPAFLNIGRSVFFRRMLNMSLAWAKLTKRKTARAMGIGLATAKKTQNLGPSVRSSVSVASDMRPHMIYQQHKRLPWTNSGNERDWDKYCGECAQTYIAEITLSASGSEVWKKGAAKTDELHFWPANCLVPTR